MANRESEQATIETSPNPCPSSILMEEAHTENELCALRRLVCDLLKTNQELRETISATRDLPIALERKK